LVQKSKGTGDTISIYGDSVPLEVNTTTIEGNQGRADTGAGITCIDCSKVRLFDNTFR